MSTAVSTLHDISTAATPSTPARVTATVTFVVFFVLAASPLAGTWIFVALIPLSLIWMWYLGFSLRTRGFRMNDYAPLKPETDGTPQNAYADRPDPKRRQQVIATYTVPAAFAVVWTANQMDNDLLRWGLTLVAAVFSGVSLWRMIVMEDGYPVDYIPVRRLFAAEPDWTPADNADAVASVLYAARAVPGGRQVRRDVLDDLAAPLVDSDDVATGLQELVAQGQAVVLRDRKDAHTVIRWTTLTDEGRDAVLHAENPATRP